MPRGNEPLTIGDLARRTGLSVSAIRFYEEKGLLQSFRTGGGQRRFLRSDIRRLSFALIAQQLGLSIEKIGSELAKLAAGTHADPGGLAPDQRRVQAGARRSHRGAGADARPARRLYRLRLPVVTKMRALQSRRPGRSRGARSATCSCAGADRPGLTDLSALFPVPAALYAMPRPRDKPCRRPHSPGE